MKRCLQLALLGLGKVAPNPMVGSVLVQNGEIIGEGFHTAFGFPHAEVECIKSVKSEDEELIPKSTIYVSLEPCSHFGKTPPCSDLIIEKKIPRVVIGCRDPFPAVNGKGIEKLQSAGVEVITPILEKECIDINKRFFHFHQQHRPYIILKWAQSLDSKMAGRGEERILISNSFTNRIVHKWRSEEAGILVGTNTALLDDPELTTRHWPGKNPIRLVMDLHLKLPKTLKIFSGGTTIIFNLLQNTINVEDLKNHTVLEDTQYYQVTEDVSLVQQISNALYHLNIESVLVEGGGYLLQSFIEEGVWDEARVITNTELVINEGLPAPTLKHHKLNSTEKIFSDLIATYKNLYS